MSSSTRPRRVASVLAVLGAMASKRTSRGPSTVCVCVDNDDVVIQKPNQKGAVIADITLYFPPFTPLHSLPARSPSR